MNARILLRRGKEESLLRRHPWIFSGAIQRLDGTPEEGDVVDVYTAGGQFIARGHYQVGSITVRVLTFRDEAIDTDWWKERLHSALEVRKTLGLACNPQTTCYRLVHGEGDSLPGLIIDVYGSTAVMQCHSAGMYRSRETIAACLADLYGGRLTAVYDKSSQTVPYLAQLGAVDGYLLGSGTGEETVLENGNRYLVNWAAGQKTGFFIDQRCNRELISRYAAGRKVLNTFCYTGGFSVAALAGGAAQVVSVDSSRSAVELACRNVALNFGPQAAHEGIAADAFDFLNGIGQQEFDLIVLDPPAFAKHHKVLGNATQGYKRLNARALSRIKSGGILFTFSCSQAVSKELFRTTVFSAAAIAGRRVRILHQLTQPADHPIDIYHPEGEYLKGLVLFVE